MYLFLAILLPINKWLLLPLHWPLIADSILVPRGCTNDDFEMAVPVVSDSCGWLTAIAEVFSIFDVWVESVVAVCAWLFEQLVIAIEQMRVVNINFEFTIAIWINYLECKAFANDNREEFSCFRYLIYNSV